MLYTFMPCIFCLSLFLSSFSIEKKIKVHGAFRDPESNLDTWQLHMSRLGLVAQAILQLIMALFLVSDVVPDVWKARCVKCC